MTLITTTVAPVTLAANDDTVLITQAGVVTSNLASAALDTNDHTGLEIINYGGIVNTVGTALNFSDGSTGAIINQAGGYIAGNDGVDIFADGASLLNFGSITGFGTGAADAAVYLGIASSGVLVDNRGQLFGEKSGIRDASSSGGNTIMNSGQVEGKAFGVSFHTVAGLMTHINNSGIIKGGTASIETHDSGRLDLINTGKLIGDISLESANALDADAIYNSGVISGAVKLGAGNDLFVGAGGTSGTVFGEAGDDHLSGGVAHDSLDGGIGDDRLFGEGGSDTLTGGDNADHFVFNTAFPFAGIDFITDFTHGVDHIDLSHAIFTKTNAAGTLAGGQFFVGTRAHDANDHIIYNASNGWLIYDANGNAAGGQHHFATLDAHLTITAADFLIA